jgi:hypothetical protein
MNRSEALQMRERHANGLVILLLSALLAVAGGCSTASTPPTSPDATLLRIASTARAAAGVAEQPRPGAGERTGTAPAIDPAVLLEATSASGFPGTVLLGRPTDRSIALSLVPASNLDLYVEYGAASGRYSTRSATAPAKAGQPIELTMTGLEPDAACFYRIRYRAQGEASFGAAVEQSFHTQRAAGSTFTFAVEADPHVDVDRKMIPELFRQELANVEAGHPDFLVDLGDTFLGDKFAASYPELAAQYANVRSYFGIAGPSVPLFLVNGNHEGEAGWLLDGTADNLAVWAARARTTYYPTPSPDGFYSGGTIAEPFVGERGSYYAWEWGDALFVVLDPYAYTTINPKQSGDLWDYTLGADQYRWLVNVLGTSTSRYKFVFAHHVVGDVRGGVEWAGLYEWGGSGKSGAYEFDEKRPGWGLPIHQLFVKYGVTIFFQGHDHFYVRQEQDGVVYQEVPQPATPGGDPQNMAHEYAYKSGVIFGSTGHLQVTVTTTGVTVDYIHSSIGTGDTSALANGEVVHSYTVASAATVPAGAAAPTLRIAGGHTSDLATAYGTAARVRNGTYVTLRTTVLPAAANTPVRVYRRIGKTGPWTYLSGGRTTAAGTLVWSTVARVPAAATGYGRYVYYRVAVPGTSGGSPSWSATVRAVVR